MRAPFPIAVFLVAACAAQPDEPAVAVPEPRNEPEWIWGRSEVRDDEVCYFRSTFRVPGEVRSARLVVSCDNRFTAWLNGIEVARGTTWWDPVSSDVTERLQAGGNLIAVRGANDNGPAALLVRLDVELASGRTVQVVSDGTWRAAFAEAPGWQSRSHDLGWPRAHSFGPSSEPDGPWPDPFASRAATPAESIAVPAGFRCELLRSARLGEGSWVCMTFDDRGRLIVSPQQGPLLRVTLSQTGPPVVEPIDLPIGSAQGLCYAHDALYVNVNATIENNGGLWRLRDTDGDDWFDEVRRLREYGPGGEHGPHAVVCGPDGALWVMNGNHTELPDPVAPTSPHRNYGDDLLLPRAWDPWGHATGIEAPGAQVFRTDPDGETWELFASGLRNPYDLAFDADGELFTFDSDMEWDIGLPWYRPTRIVHVVSGGEYGWRSGSAKWPSSHADSLPAAVDLGEGSPTGLTFGTSSNFPRRYRDALFACDWAYGRIFAVHLESAGASFTGSSEVFVRGEPLNVTDLEFGPDGALYFTTGGRGTQAGLYRVRWEGGRSHGTQPYRLAQARARRHDLEAFHGRADDEAVTTAWPWLRSRDRWLRYAARIAIESQDPEQWQERALGEEDTRAALAALLALARVGDPALQARLLQRLGELEPALASEQMVLDWLRAHDLCMVRMGPPEETVASAVRARLGELYPASSFPLNRELSRLLVYLAAPDVAAETMALLEAAREPREQIHFAWVLRSLETGWTAGLRDRYFAWLRTARDLEGGHSFSGFLDAMREDALAHLPEAGGVDWAAETRVAEPELGADVAIRSWKLEDLAPALVEVDAGRSFESGRSAYSKALCSACHRLGGTGGDIGPDLTGSVGRFSRRDLLTAILLPSQDVSDQYRSTVVTLQNGDSVVGRVVEDTDDALTLRIGFFGDERVEIAHSDIARREESNVSSMPPGLANVLTRDEILDLVAYIEAGGKADDRRFR